MKIVKYLFILLLILAIGGFIAIKVISEKEPAGQAGDAADQVANAVLAKLNKPAFDTIPYLRWEFFRPGQKYFWDKKNNIAIIEWDDNKVIMQLDSQKAVAFTAGIAQEGETKEKLKAKAWSNWCNDSFWMIAPFKLFDAGTTREIVEFEDEKQSGVGLHVKYNSGGVTPGDSYLWSIGKDKIPTGYKMWTSIIPVKGMYASWSGWEEHMGALLSTQHEIAGKAMEMKQVKAGNHWSEFGYDSDPFNI